MKTMFRYHVYRLKKECEKKSDHVMCIIPTSDIVVTNIFFDEYEEVRTMLTMSDLKHSTPN